MATGAASHGTREEGHHRVVEDTITGKGHVPGHTEVVVNCHDAMLECTGLPPILTAGQDTPVD